MFEAGGVQSGAVLGLPTGGVRLERGRWGLEGSFHHCGLQQGKGVALRHSTMGHGPTGGRTRELGSGITQERRKRLTTLIGRAEGSGSGKQAEGYAGAA